MKKSGRQIRIAEQEARDCLLRLYSIIQELDPAFRYSNIDKVDRPKKEIQREPVRDAVIKEFFRAPKHVRRFSDAAFEILSALSSKTNPSPAACDIIRAALNWKVDQWSIDVSKKPKLIIKRNLMREAAEVFSRYIDLTEICGLIPMRCRLEGCDAVVIGHRRSKRFCSTKHQQAFHTYTQLKKKHGKHYFAENRYARLLNDLPLWIDPLESHLDKIHGEVQRNHLECLLLALYKKEERLLSKLKQLKEKRQYETGR